ncbi:MAG TPA: YIP1 family protein [Vicinamibacterales bacterium]
MTDTIAASEPIAARSMSLPARVIGVLTSPRATYADVAARPRWFGVLALIVVLGAIGIYSFMSTDIGKQAMLDQQVRMMESFGVKVSDVAYQKLEDGLGRAAITGALGQAIGFPIAALIVSGILIAIFNAVMGGNAVFGQVFAIVSHSAVVLALAQLFGLPLAYARETMSGATNLGVFLPFLDDASFPARFLGSIDLFYIWWMVSLSIGLGVLYRKRTTPIAVSMLVVYAVIALVVAAARTAVAGA